MVSSDELGALELTSIEERGDAADVPRLAAECRRLRRALVDGVAAAAEAADRARLRAEGRAEAAELELERAHRLLDEYGAPRESRLPGQRDAIEYSLLGRLQVVLDDEA